ncbi:hypothetical protein MKW92_023807 [Papaver armeniacum]|nr:hypothetical protein MKW92_023807 [Papaver armeniacum]
MGSVAEDSHEETWRNIWTELSKHRIKLENLFKKWDKLSFDDKILIFEPYLSLLLRTCPRLTGDLIRKYSSDIDPNLESLQKLHTFLGHDIVEGKRNLIEKQIKIVCAQKKVAKMLCYLDCCFGKGTGTVFLDALDAAFQKRFLQKPGNKDWEHYLELLNGIEADVLYRATVLGVQLQRPPDHVWVGHPSEVNSQLKAYYEDLKDAVNILEVYELIKKIMSELKPDDNVKEERQDGVQTTVEEVNGDKWGPREATMNYKKNRGELCYLVYCLISFG